MQHTASYDDEVVGAFLRTAEQHNHGDGLWPCDYCVVELQHFMAGIHIWSVSRGLSRGLTSDLVVAARAAFRRVRVADTYIHAKTWCGACTLGLEKLSARAGCAVVVRFRDVFLSICWRGALRLFLRRRFVIRFTAEPHGAGRPPGPGAADCYGGAEIDFFSQKAST